jgi:transcriptional regulator with XRE-family HTH domain
MIFRSEQTGNRILMAKAPLDIVKGNVAQQIRELRRSLELSQTQLAAKAETHQEFISDVERGEANPTLETIVRIATALGVDTIELFGTKQGKGLPRKRLRKRAK